MNLDDFRKSLTEPTPPAGLDQPLKAMWYAGKGSDQANWDKAHEIAQAAGGDGDRDGDWVHAYLHRVEGDLSNAGYWYGRCGRPRHDGALQDEWAEIVTALLGRG